MAGTPKFDRDEVLMLAAQEFADRGYEGASVSQLVAATGLLRGSLYGAFGSKSELFRLAYAQAVTGKADSDVLLDLTVVALRERASDDREVAALAQTHLHSIENHGVPASQQIYSRLLARASIDLDQEPPIK